MEDYHLNLYCIKIHSFCDHVFKKKKRQTLGIAGEINDDIKKFIFLYQSL